MRKLGKYAVVAAGLLVLAASVHAQTPPKPGVVDQVLKNFISASAAWEGNIGKWANRLFYLLAVIDIAWMGITMAFKEGGGIQSFVAELIRRIFFIGFYLALLQYGNTWSTAIVSSFQQVGAGAIADSGLSATFGDLPVYDTLSPSSLGIIGIKYADLIMATLGVGAIINPGQGIMMALLGLLVVVGFGMIMIRMVIVLAEAYVVLSAGVILLGFGGSRWTKDYATNYLRYAVSIGVKLFFIQISVALGVSFIDSLAFSVGAITIEAGLALVLALGLAVVLVFMLPNAAADLIRGHSNSSGNEGFALGAAATAAALTMVSRVAAVMAPPVAPAAAAAAASASAASAATTRAAGGGGSLPAAAKGLAGGMSKPAGAPSNGGGPKPPNLSGAGAKS